MRRSGKGKAMACPEDKVSNKLDLSIVIPIFNEEKNINELCSRLIKALDEVDKTYEIIFVDDGSVDGSFELLKQVAGLNEKVKIIRFVRNFGQTAAMSAGINASKGDILVSMDGDLQNDPADIKNLLAKLDEGYDVVSGWRKNRQDKLSRKLPSRIANQIISIVSGVHLHDYGCSLKAYKREIIKEIKLYGEMHRFIPIYASWQGAKIAEIPVLHDARRFGKSKYGISRIVKVILDLITVKFMGSYVTKPIYVFGVIGLISIGVGSVIAIFVLVRALFFQGEWVSPLILIAFFVLSMGVLSILIGLLAEISVRTYFESQDKPPYVIKEIIGGDDK